MARHPDRPDGPVAENVDESVESASRVGSELPLAEWLVTFEQPLDIRPENQVLHRPRRGLAGPRIDRRVLGNVGHAHHVIEVQMRQEHAHGRTALCEEGREIGAHDELLLDLHEVGYEAAHCRPIGIVDGAFDPCVDDEHPALRMPDDVEAHDDRLRAIDETGRLGLWMLEIQEPGQRHLPVGRVDALERDRTRPIEDRE